MTKTILGCKCLNDWAIMQDGKVESGCVYGDLALPKSCPLTKDRSKVNETKCTAGDLTSWCIVEKGCGRGGVYKKPLNAKQLKEQNTAKDTGYWDFCGWGRGDNMGGWSWDIKMSRETTITSTIGLFIFIILFGFVLPYIFYKLGWEEIIDVWVPNLDLLATVVSFRNGILPGRLFAFLWAGDWVGGEYSTAYWSKIIIQYVSLLGVVVIVGKHIRKTNHLYRGVSFALVMFLITYLVPNDAINSMMDKIYGYVIKKKKMSEERSSWIATFAGMVTAIGFIATEKLLMTTQLHKLDRISEFIIKKIWFFLGNTDTTKKHNIKKRKK